MTARDACFQRLVLPSEGRYLDLTSGDPASADADSPPPMPSPQGIARDAPKQSALAPATNPP